jgi:hypothetical protein
MNEILESVWIEKVRRLRLGVEPLDALGSIQILPEVGLFIESVPRPHRIPPVTGRQLAMPNDPIGLPGVRRSPSGRFALAFIDGRVPSPRRIDVRLVDPDRRYVPRRFAIVVPLLSEVLAADRAHQSDPSIPLAPRACQPLLFPGQNGGVQAGATVIRGRATWGVGGPPAPWTRIEATAIGASRPRTWRAHGDDRGEFVLVIGALELAMALALTRTVDITVVVSGRPLPSPAAGAPIESPAESREDPLWHLPLEQVSTLDPPDPVLRGEVQPPGYSSSTTRTITCRRGAVTRPAQPFVLN